MAKLNGVKVIDAVGGEITKVAYNGAEYARIANNFKDAQTDDLFLSGGGMDETEGAFYAINYEDRGDGHPIKFVDDAGVKNGYVKEAPYPLFRKISAQTTPTIEERVEELEAEVAQLKAQQTEVKPESNAKLKAGDFIKITNSVSCGLSFNKIYEIGIDEDGDEYVVSDNESGISYDIHGNGVEYILATEEEVAKHRESAKWAKIGRKPGEFKKGDIVRVTGNCSGHEIRGQLGEVAKDLTPIDGGDNRPYVKAVYDGGLVTLWANVELITPVDARFDK